MKHKNDIDDLLNGYIDDELSPRQQTEVKRLIARDKQVAEKLNQLKMCKTLVSALPNEEAPYDLLEDIKSALERKTLLEETPQHYQKKAGNKYLHFRKLLASAAIIALFAVLGTIIYSVIGPGISDSTSTDWKNLTKPVAENTTAEPVKPKVVIKPENMIASIELETDAFIATNAFIRKTIEENGLSNNAAPTNPESAGIYYISSSRSNINLLLADISSIEQRFKSVNLRIASADGNSNTSIENLSFNQIHEIINQPSFDQSKQIARAIAALNYTNYNSPAKNMLASVFDKTPQALTIPKPVLTSGDKASKTSAAKDADKDRAYLMIKLIPTK